MIERWDKLTHAEIARYYIASQTYNHLLTLIRGFVGYAWCILEYSDADIIFPVLHCNQSSFEAFFLVSVIL